MTLISESDQKLLDPLSEKVKEKIQELEIGIDCFKLREFAFHRAAQFVLKRRGMKVPEKDSDLKKLSPEIQKLIEYEVKLDYTHQLRNLVNDFVKLYKPQRGKISLEDHKARIDALTTYYEGVFAQDIVVENREDQEIDQPVALGGLTRLHIAAQDGNLEEVKRLIEKEQAKAGVRDNSNYTPKERAILMNRTAVIEYLANFS